MATYERDPKRSASRRMRDESRDLARQNKSAVAAIGQATLDRRIARKTASASNSIRLNELRARSAWQE